MFLILPTCFAEERSAQGRKSYYATGAATTTTCQANGLTGAAGTAFLIK